MTAGKKSRRVKYAAIYVGGGLAYGALELLFRGRTHWTMLLAGGLCTVLLFVIAARSREALWKKWIMGGAVITTVELLTGIAVNLVLGWHVWSYSGEWLNLDGQICLLFSLLWVALSVPAIWLLMLLNRRVFKESEATTTGGIP